MRLYAHPFIPATPPAQEEAPVARHPFHNDAMPCPLADSYLGVIGGLEEARDEMNRNIGLLKDIVRRDATEHLNWRAAHAAPREEVQ